MDYTTPSSVAEYMGIPVMDLPDNINILIREASALMDYVSLNYIQDYYVDQDTLLFTNSVIETRVETATNAQIEYWDTIGGTALDVTGSTPASFSIGNFSVSYGGANNNLGNNQNILAPRAKRALFMAGLLYRGVGR